MTRRLIVFRALIFGSAAAAQAASSRPPNFLFIIADDQGWPTLGGCGNRLVATPHLDSLAPDDVRFTEAYVMPQCIPTRAALLTGQHTARTALWHVIPWYGTPWAPVRADVGVLFSNEGGEGTQARAYLFDHSPGASITADVPSEAGLRPQQ